MWLVGSLLAPPKPPPPDQSKRPTTHVPSSLPSPSGESAAEVSVSSVASPTSEETATITNRLAPPGRPQRPPSPLTPTGSPAPQKPTRKNTIDKKRPPPEIQEPTPPTPEKEEDKPVEADKPASPEPEKPAEDSPADSGTDQSAEDSVDRKDEELSQSSQSPDEKVVEQELENVEKDAEAEQAAAVEGEVGEEMLVDSPAAEEEGDDSSALYGDGSGFLLPRVMAALGWGTANWLLLSLTLSFPSPPDCKQYDLPKPNLLILVITSPCFVLPPTFSLTKKFWLLI